MQTKPVFDGRPELDRVFRIFCAVLAVGLLVAAVVTQDLRSGAVAMFLGAFLLRETFELDERQRQATLVVLVASAAVWAIEVFG